MQSPCPGTAARAVAPALALALSLLIAPGAKAHDPTVYGNAWHPPASRFHAGTRRPASLWDLRTSLRPFVVLGDLGAGFLLEASVAYHFDLPFLVRAELMPSGLLKSEGEDRIGTGGFAGMGGLDLRLLGLLLGIGGQTVNLPDFGELPGRGTSIRMDLRLGAEDGLHVLFRASTVLFRREFEFGSLGGWWQIPVARRAWLLLGGEAGLVGYFIGDLGMRALVRGHGGPGSIFVRGGLGVTGLLKASNDDFFEEEGHGGVHVLLGAEWRL